MKFIQLFLKESQFKKRLIVFCILMFMALMQTRVLHAKRGQLEALKVLASQVVEQTKPPVEISKSEPVVEYQGPNLIFEGLTTQDGKTYALISGQILTQGDSYSGYDVVEITTQKATLQNKETQEIRMLYLKG